MTKQEVFEKFPSGQVMEEIANHKALNWIGRILAIIIMVFAVYHSRGTTELFAKFIDYAVLVIVLWWTHHIADPKVFICEKGLVILRGPIDLRERFDILFHEEAYFVFLAYEQIIGFTESWEEIQAVSNSGGLYMMQVDLQFVAYPDKMKLIQAISQ